MAQALRVEVAGLRDLLGRFGRDLDADLRARQDALLRTLAGEAKEHLQQRAPRGTGPGPRLADMFQVTSLEREGGSASVAISNEKEVSSKSGRTWALLRLLTTGTPPHAIEGQPLLVFQKDGQTIFARRVQHPGTQPNDFVAQVAEDLDIQRRLLTTARGALVDLAGGR